MKITTLTSPVAPAETKTPTPANPKGEGASARTEAQRIDELLPPEVKEAVRLDAEWDQLTAEMTAATDLSEEAAAALKEELPDADLRDEKSLARIAKLQAQAVLGVQKAELLGTRLEAKKKGLVEASHLAAQRVNSALDKVARGHQEIAAQAIGAQFESIKEARKAMANHTAVRLWSTERIQALYGDAANCANILRMARKAFPELEKVSAQLGGEIPTAAEMSAF